MSTKTFKQGITLTPVSADPSSPKDGELQLSDGTHRAKGYYRYDLAATTWNSLGGGGGGLDIFYTENLESTKAADFITGSASIPDAAGTGLLDGTLSDETAAPIAGTQSLRYVQDAAATHDFFLNDTDLALDPKQVDQIIGATFYYTYDGSDDAIRFFILDQDDSELTSSTEFLKANTNATRFSTSVYIPAGTTGIRYGFQVDSGEYTKILIVDDLELSTNPFVYKNLVVSESAQYYTYAGNGSTNTYIPYFTNEVSNDIASRGTIVNDSTSGFTFTARGECVVTISFSGSYAGGGGHMGITKNGVLTSTITNAGNDGKRLASEYSSAADQPCNATAEIKCVAGDVITPHLEVTSGGSTANRAFGLSITAESSSEHVVTPAETQTEYYSAVSVTNFWDLATSTAEWDHSLLVPSFADSKLISIADTASQTRITALEKINLEVSISGRTDSSGYIAIRNSSGDALNAASTNSTGEHLNISTSITLEKDDYIYMDNDNPHSSRTGSTTIRATKYNVSFLAAVPMNYTQTKILSADVTAVGQATDLTFNNLVIGKEYQISGQISLSASNGTSVVTIRSEAISAGTLYQGLSLGSTDSVNADVTNAPLAINNIFTAVSTELYVYFLTDAGQISGDGTKGRTFVTLTELNYTKETTRFT
jgi:hypothetical protein